MEDRRLGPVVGLGTWNTFRDDAMLAGAVVAAAFDAGVRCFDTSPMYSSERALGAAVEGRRDEATVLTKIWTPSADEARSELAARLAGWTPPDNAYDSGVFARYRAQVRSASEGAVLRP